MTRGAHEKGFPALAFVIAALITLGVFVPFLGGGPGPKSLVEGVSVFAAPHDSFIIAVPVELAGRPRIVLERGTLSFATDHASKSGDGGRLADLLAGGAAELVLDDALISIDLGSVLPRMAPSRGAQEGVAPLLEALMGSKFESVRVRGATIVVRSGEASTEQRVNLDADVQKNRNGGLETSGKFTFRGEGIAFTGVLGPLDGGGPEGRPMKLKLDGAQLNALVDGHLSTLEEVKLVADRGEISVPDIRRVADWFGAPWPQGSGLRDFRAIGQLEWSGRGIDFQDAAIEIDGNKGHGNLTLAFAEARPSIEGTLAFEGLDLTRYVVPEGAGSEGSAHSSPYVPGGGDDAFSIPLLGYLDADLRISAERVAAPGLDFGRAAASLSLQDGRLLADIAELSLSSGGSGGGQISLDMTGSEPRYGLRGKLEGLEAIEATRALFGHPVLQGRIDATLDMTAEGASGERLLSTLAGKLDIELPDTGQLGIDARVLASMAAGASASGWGEAANGATPVDWLLGKFTLDGGVVTAQAFMAGAGTKQISAAGSASLPSRTLDLRLSVSPRLGADQTGVPVPDTFVEVKGPWSSPHLTSIDPAKAARH